MKASGKILLIDDEEFLVSMLARSLRSAGYETRVETSTEGIIDKIESWYPDLILLDVNLPGKNGIVILQEILDGGIDTQVVMLTADNSAMMAIKALKIGAADYLTKPFNTDEVKIVVQNLLERGKLKDEVDYLRRDKSKAHDYGIVVDSSHVQEMMDTVEKLAEAKVKTILITGESGTGKELMARHIHTISHCEPFTCNTPFVTVNCTALPDHLFESELFGYVKGAFTDAKTDRKGLFELANGGSILLDEIGDMKEGLQAKLLRVLEERKIRRVGGKADLPIDVTVIATTNRNLQEAVEAGSFRMDLFYRLNTFPLVLLPLRERKASIPALANHFLSLFSKKYNKTTIKAFSPAAEKILCAYDWPGNVRELKNVVERIVVLEEAEIIQAQQLPFELHKQPRPETETQTTDEKYVLPDEGIDLQEFEKDLYSQALAKANHNMSKAAKLLNLSYDSFRNHAKKYRLE